MQFKEVFWQSGVKEYLTVSVSIATYTAAPEKVFLKETALLRQVRVSPGTLLQCCSGPSDWSSSAPPQWKCYSSALLCSSSGETCYFSAPLHYTLTKEAFTQISFKGFIVREDSRRVAASARVEKDSSKLNRNKTHIGLLKGSFFFPGWRFSGWELVLFQLLSLNKFRDWLDFVLRYWLVSYSEICWFSSSGIGWFLAELVRVRVCFFYWPFLAFCLWFQDQGVFSFTGFGFRPWVYFFGWPFTLQQQHQQNKSLSHSFAPIILRYFLM